MNFDLTGGTLFIQTDDHYMKLSDNVTGVAEVKMSAKETPSVMFNLNTAADFSCELEYSNTLFELCMDETLKEWSLEYNVPIKIQSRWHKKPRIRKKWLKRYGMKNDVVKVVCKTPAITVFPGEADLSQVEFMMDSMEYVWRPDQLRRGIEIDVWQKGEQ